MFLELYFAKKNKKFGDPPSLFDEQDRKMDVDSAVKRTLEEVGIVTYQSLRNIQQG